MLNTVQFMFRYTRNDNINISLTKHFDRILKLNKILIENRQFVEITLLHFVGLYNLLIFLWGNYYAIDYTAT